MRLPARADELAPELTEIRRDIHAHPELLFQERRTTAPVAEGLRRSGGQTRMGVGVSGCVGELHDEAVHPVTLCAAMDVLPIPETNDLTYRSRLDGIMRAPNFYVGATCLPRGVAVLAIAAQRRLAAW